MTNPRLPKRRGWNPRFFHRTELTPRPTLWLAWLVGLNKKEKESEEDWRLYRECENIIGEKEKEEKETATDWDQRSQQTKTYLYIYIWVSSGLETQTPKTDYRHNESWNSGFHSDSWTKCPVKLSVGLQFWMVQSGRLAQRLFWTALLIGMGHNSWSWSYIEGRKHRIQTDILHSWPMTSNCLMLQLV